jgi:hypothetical protein
MIVVLLWWLLCTKMSGIAATNTHPAPEWLTEVVVVFVVTVEVSTGGAEGGAGITTTGGAGGGGGGTSTGGCGVGGT